LFVDALETTVLLARAHQSGEVLSLEQLRAVVKLPWEEMEFILDRLVACGWVAKLQDHGWILARDADSIPVIEIFQNFVIRSEAVFATDIESIRDLVSHIVTDSDKIINMTLAELAYGDETRKRSSKKAA